MGWDRIIALFVGLCAAGFAAAILVARFVTDSRVTTDPALTMALSLSAAGLLYAASAAAARRARSLDEQNASLKRVAEVQKRTVERLQFVNAELKENEQRYRGLVDAQGDVILRKWPDGRLTFVNDAFLDVFGVRREEAIGRSFRPEFHPDDPPPLVRDYAGGGERPRARYDQRIRTAAGWRWYAWEDYAIRGEAGQVSEIQSVGRDITERKEVESAIKAARDRAEQTNRAKSLFLATMSHEIRTPMNGVIGMAGLLLDTPLSPDQRAYALAVKQSGEGLVELINDILDFSKIEAGGLELTREPFGVRQLVDSVAELLSTRAYQKGIDIAACVDEDVPEALLGDESRLRQVLLNLAGNAVKFTEKGGVAIRVARVSCPRSEGRGAIMARFEIVDTGIGVPEEARDRIFGTFEQADSTHSRKYGGSGLGLAISKKIVEHMGGEIGVDSPPGRGSVFWFTAQLAPNRAAETAAPPPDLTGKRIVVISPWPILRDVMVARLRQGGAEAEGFDAVGDALVTLMARDHHGALVDVRLGEPDVEGQIGQLRNWLPPGAAIVPLLPPSQRARIPALKAAGATAYHITPVRHFWLERRLAAVFAGRSPDAERPAASAAALPGPEPAPESSAPAAGPAPEPDALRVLVAEDNEINTLLTVSLLKRMGLAVDSVRDGAEAIAALQSRSDYVLVLMDVHMPGVDGIEATRRIRAAEKARAIGARPRLPIIALTASVMDEDRQNCLAAGMDDFLTKPLDPNALTRVLSRWAVKPRDRAA